MNAEIELKLLVSPQDHDSLIKTLNKLPNTSYCKSDFLFNHYFDTNTLQLARWDMGLRIRGSKNHQEQTIKTAGSVINGLHSRPEYNIPTAEKTPNLLLFPKYIWPKCTVIAELNSTLMAIFDTNFTRHTWIININQSKIEIALDSGAVITPKGSCTISELELELIEGNNADLILLGLMVADYIPLRLGQQSKALTGYLLSGRVPYQFNTIWPTVLNSLKDPTDITPEALKALFKVGLNHWQQLEHYLQHISHNDNAQNTPQYNSALEQLLRCITVICLSMLQHKMLCEQLKQDIEPLTALINKLVVELTAISKSALQLPHQTTQPLSIRIETLWQYKGYGKLQLALMRFITT